jgi:hypothetical protein
MWATSLIKKTAQSKQSPTGLKIAQSGHPASSLTKQLIDPNRMFVTKK